MFYKCKNEGQCKSEIAVSLLITGLLLTGCGSSSRKSADQKNTRTNDTSEYVEQHMNNRQFKQYVTDTTYDKVNNTIESHLTPTASREMKGQRPNKYKYQSIYDSRNDRHNFHKLVKKNMMTLRNKAHNSSAKAKLIYHK